MAYNTMYERLVDQGGNEVSGYIAYGLYKQSKREWVREFEADRGRSPDGAEQASYVATYTPQIVAALQTQADGILTQFASSAVDDARPKILKEALRGSTGRAIGLSLLSNAVYTLLLIAVVLILRYAGVDLLGIFDTARG